MTSSDPSYSSWYVFYKATNLPEWGFLDDSSSYYFSFLGQEDHDHFRKLNFASIFISVSLLWIKLVIRSRIKNRKRSFFGLDVIKLFTCWGRFTYKSILEICSGDIFGDLWTLKSMLRVFKSKGLQPGLEARSTSGLDTLLHWYLTSLSGNIPTFFTHYQ